RFFANVSHELRTPLTLLLAPLDDLLAGRAAVDFEVLGAMAASARRLLKQVNELLKLSKLDAGDLSCSFEEGNIGQVGAALVSAAQAHAASRGITLSFRTAPLPDTSFDRDKVETIVANLLSNALKFTPSGGSVEVSVRERDPVMEIEVKDSGRGI